MADTLLAKTPNIDMGEHFWLENVGTQPLTFKWAKVPYSVKPNERKFLPFAIIALHYGDPRSRIGMAQTYSDSTGQGIVPERNAELARLCVRYGVYEQGMESIHANMLTHKINGEPAPLDDRYMYVKITNANGDEIIPPLFDPKGELTYGFTKSTEKSSDVATIIDTLTEQIDAYKLRLEALEARGGDNDDGDVAVDDPMP